MSFKRILVPINHSPLTSIVFERALSLAQKEQANLMILHCLTDVARLAPVMVSSDTLGIYPNDARFSLALYDETLQFEIQQATVWLQSYRQKATSLNINTEYQHQFGDPGITICNVAQEWKADLIILGRHDHTTITEFFTGSTSNHVIHCASCSVLVVKDAELS